MASYKPYTFGKAHWMDRRRNSDFLTYATLAQAAILGCALTSEFFRWTGRCCLYPQGSRDYKESNKVRERSHCKTCWTWDWNLPVACRCNACLWDCSDILHRGTDGLICGEPYTLHELWTSVMLFDAGWWGFGLLHFAYAGHYLPLNYGPTYSSLGVPDPNTLVNSLLHQMHLMHLTWFNGAHHRWRKPWGGHSSPASIMLK